MTDVHSVACPACGGWQEVHAIDDSGRAPSAGLPGVCGHCGAFMTFDDDGTAHLATTDEIADLDDEQRIAMLRYRRYVEARNANEPSAPRAHFRCPLCDSRQTILRAIARGITTPVIAACTNCGIPLIASKEGARLVSNDEWMELPEAMRDHFLADALRRRLEQIADEGDHRGE